MKRAIVTVQMVSIQCPHGCPGDDGLSFIDDRTGSYSLSSDSAIQGGKLDGKSTVTCYECGNKVTLPKVRF